MGKKLAGARVLFVVRNPQGIGTLINYLSTLKIKTWTVSNIKDVPQKITENQIDVIMMSINLKGLQIETVCNLLYREFKVPTILFAEETSRRIEMDLARIDVSHKITPPNQNSKFLGCLQKVLGSDLEENDDGRRSSRTRTNWLPPNAVPVLCEQVPKVGKWIKLDPDAGSPPPYTFKLAQPRSAAASGRYFFVGDLPPLGSEPSGFFTADKVVVMGGVANGEDEENYDSNVPGGKKKRAAPFEFGDADPSWQAPVDNDLQSHIESRLGLAGQKNEIPTTAVERALKEAASYINRISTPQPVPQKAPTHFMACLVKTNTSEGYLLTTLIEDQVLESTAFSELSTIFRAKLKEHSEVILEMTPPLLFEQEMLDFLPWAEASSFFMTQPDEADQNLVYIFVKAPLGDVLLTQSGDDMFSVPLSTLRSDIKLTFDLFVALPLNNKYLLYRRKGSVFSETSILKFEKHNVDKIFIRSEDQNRYYAYRASAFMAEKRKAQGF